MYQTQLLIEYNFIVMAEQNVYSVNFLEKCIVPLHNMYILVYKRFIS